MNANLEIIPAINKVDLPAADPERVRSEIEDGRGKGQVRQHIPAGSHIKGGAKAGRAHPAIVKRQGFPVDLSVFVPVDPDGRGGGVQFSLSADFPLVLVQGHLKILHPHFGFHEAYKGLGAESDAESAEMTAPAESGLREGLGAESRSRKIEGRDCLGAVLQETEQVIGYTHSVEAAEIEIQRDERIVRPESDRQQVQIQVHVEAVTGMDLLQECRGGNVVVHKRIDRSAVSGRVEQRAESQVAPSPDASLA